MVVHPLIADAQRQPGGSIQDAMIRLKVEFCAESHDPENHGNRPLAWGEDGVSEKNLNMLPNRSRKDRSEDGNHTDEFGRQREHCSPFMLRNDVHCLWVGA